MEEADRLSVGLRPAIVGRMISSAPRPFRTVDSRQNSGNTGHQDFAQLQYASLQSGDDRWNYNLRQASLADYTGTVGRKPLVLGDPRLRPRYPDVNRVAKGDRIVPRNPRSLLARPAADDPRRMRRLFFEAPFSALVGREPGFVVPDSTASGAPLSRQLAAERRRSIDCLAKAIYFEARSEPRAGQLAVAQVIVNRVEHWFYPNDVCSVVFQNEARRNKCQFSFACDGRSDRARDMASWSRSVTLAREVLENGLRSEVVGTKATHYHANYVRPRWIRDMVRIARIGRHIFYRVRRWS